jgi:YegS/Rv2252/BmrU family lipid kinase
MGTEERAIVNPERTDAADELTERADVSLDRPDAADEIAVAAQRAVDDGIEIVAAVGGDGTQRTVAESVAHTDSQLAVVPGGTVNLLGRVLGIETIADAAEAIERGEARALDLARCDGQAFLLNSSSGYDAEVIAHTGDRAKRFGRLGYTAVGLRELIRGRTDRCTVTVDAEEIFADEALTVLVLNVGQRGSADFKIAPDAEPDDGLLDVVIIRASRRSLLRTGVARARKRLPAPHDAVFAQGREIEVAWDDDVAVQCDGDATDRRRTIRYTIEPAAVAVRVPSSS